MTRSVLDDMNAAYPEDATEISAGVRSAGSRPWRRSSGRAPAMRRNPI